MRRLVENDLPAACELTRLAGWNQTEADWRGYLAFEPEGCWVAEEDGRVAGTALAITYGREVGWIGMVLVHPDFRRRGLGTRMLRHAIAWLRERNVRAIKLDATPAGRQVYVPLGFVDEGEIVRWQVERVAPNALDGRLPATPFSALGATRSTLDCEAFGVDRERILANLAGRQPGWCFVVRQGEQIDGYLIARRGREAAQIGPWVARDAAAAWSLFDAFAAAAPGERVFLDVPAENRAGTDLVKAHGFTVQRGFTRMRLGAASPGGNLRMIYGTSGAEKG